MTPSRVVRLYNRVEVVIKKAVCIACVGKFRTYS